jgi:cation transport regulator ChaB
MIYKTRKDLPATVTDTLPADAQEIYMKTYNRVWNENNEGSTGHLSRHSVAHREGWATVERAFAQDPKTGIWHRKGDKVSEGNQTLLDRLKDAVEGVVS